MKEDTYHRAINEFLSPETSERQKSTHRSRVDGIGAGKRMTQSNPKALELKLRKKRNKGAAGT